MCKEAEAETEVDPMAYATEMVLSLTLQRPNIGHWQLVSWLRSQSHLQRTLSEQLASR